MTGATGRGPLSGVRVLELGGIGPTPFAGMMMADQGADVVRVDLERGPVARFHQDLPRARGDDLADDVAGHHFELKRQR